MKRKRLLEVDSLKEFICVRAGFAAALITAILLGTASCGSVTQTAGLSPIPSPSPVPTSTPTPTPISTPTPTTTPTPSPTPLAGIFTLTPGVMDIARFNHSATLLDDGTVLITAGVNSSFACVAVPSCFIQSSERFDPGSGTFTKGPTMIAGRHLHTATRLQTGMVLIAGGVNSTGFLATTELFDPATNSFHSSGSMAENRRQHTATLLNDGKVLIAGGFSLDATPDAKSRSSAELYDPATGAFSSAGTMSTGRTDHAAALLNDGRVLITGGNILCTATACGFINAFATAELYDPAANAFSGTGSMATARLKHTATVLPSGMVVISGGQTPDADNFQYIPTASIEIYDPATGTFSPGGSLTIARFSHTATLLDNGQILFAGGLDLTRTPLKSAELYSPDTHISTAVSDMSDLRMGHTATILLNGQVLVAGGSNGASELASGEIFK